MTYETIPIEAKDAGTVHMLVGTVTDVDITNNKVDVNIDNYGDFADVSVFYHCENSQTADGMPFLGGERAIIVNHGDAVNLSVADMKVVGFEDGLPRTCPFYIRPTFNGFSPTYGGEQIKIEHPDYDSDDPEDLRSEIASTIVTGDFAGLCGPFTQAVDTGDEYIYLNAEDGYYFAHFVEAPDADYHYGYTFKNLTWFGAGKKEFEMFSPHPSPILHVNRIDWLRYGNTLSGCPKTTETIDGKQYAIYQVDFTNLYLLELIFIDFLTSDFDACSGCTLSYGEAQYNPTLYRSQIGGVHASKYYNHGGCLLFQGGGCEPLPSDRDQTNYGTCWGIEGISNHTFEFILQKEQICILSDEFGANPSYTALDIEVNFWSERYAQGCCDGGGGDLACLAEDVEYPRSRVNQYRMVLTPEDRF